MGASHDIALLTIRDVHVAFILHLKSEQSVVLLLLLDDFAILLRSPLVAI